MILLPQSLESWDYRAGQSLSSLICKTPSAQCFLDAHSFRKQSPLEGLRCSVPTVSLGSKHVCLQSHLTVLSLPQERSGCRSWLPTRDTYLGGKISAKLEFLQSQGHGVSPKEKDEGHERQVWDKLAGAPKQAPTVAQTRLLAQQGPVQRCEVKGGVLGDQAQKKGGQDPPVRQCALLPVTQVTIPPPNLQGP